MSHMIPPTHLYLHLLFSQQSPLFHYQKYKNKIKEKKK